VVVRVCVWLCDCVHLVCVHVCVCVCVCVCVWGGGGECMCVCVCVGVHVWLCVFIGARKTHEVASVLLGYAGVLACVRACIHARMSQCHCKLYYVCNVRWRWIICK